MTAIERLRALEKKWRETEPTYTDPIYYDDADRLTECADELATLIAELGQEVGAVGDSRRPSDAALAVAFWDARKTINESPDWVTPVEVIHWGDEIVRRAREYGTRTSPAHTSEARDAVSDAMVERAMNASMPGGSTAWVWLFNCEGGMRPEDKHRDWFRRVLSAAMRQEGE